MSYDLVPVVIRLPRDRLERAGLQGLRLEATPDGLYARGLVEPGTPMKALVTAVRQALDLALDGDRK